MDSDLERILAQVAMNNASSQTPDQALASYAMQPDSQSAAPAATPPTTNSSGTGGGIMPWTGLGTALGSAARDIGQGVQAVGNETSGAGDANDAVGSNPNGSLMTPAQAASNSSPLPPPPAPPPEVQGVHPGIPPPAATPPPAPTPRGGGGVPSPEMQLVQAQMQSGLQGNQENLDVQRANAAAKAKAIGRGEAQRQDLALQYGPQYQKAMTDEANQFNLHNDLVNQMLNKASASYEMPSTFDKVMGVLSSVLPGALGRVAGLVGGIGSIAEGRIPIEQQMAMRKQLVDTLKTGAEMRGQLFNEAKAKGETTEAAWKFSQAMSDKQVLDETDEIVARNGGDQAVAELHKNNADVYGKAAEGMMKQKDAAMTRALQSAELQQKQLEIVRDNAARQAAAQAMSAPGSLTPQQVQDLTLHPVYSKGYIPALGAYASPDKAEVANKYLTEKAPLGEALDQAIEWRKTHGTSLDPFGADRATGEALGHNLTLKIMQSDEFKRMPGEKQAEFLNGMVPSNLAAVGQQIAKMEAMKGSLKDERNAVLGQGPNGLGINLPPNVISKPYPTGK